MSPWQLGRKREREDPVMDFFKSDGSAMVCQVNIDKGYVSSKDDANSSPTASNICGSKFAFPQHGEKDSGTRVGNLKKHLNRFHPNEFEVVKKREQERNAASSGSNSNKKLKSNQPSSTQKKMTGFFKSDKIVITHTRESYKATIVDRVVKSSNSLWYFSQQPYIDLAGEIATKLQE